MKAVFKTVLAAVSTTIAVCALTACSANRPAGHAPVSHTVRVNGGTYILRQITDSTWTANVQGSLAALPATSAGTAGLRQAVEQTSGCKVTDSDYSRQGSQFDAQVKCGSR